MQVGGSTKVGSQKIGRKGIGFKSVFKITDTPHVISGGYQFRFHRGNQLGYILPEWIESLDALPERPERNGTIFYLPLNAGCEEDLRELYYRTPY